MTDTAKPGLEWREEVRGEPPVQVGRGPRAMRPEELRALGHGPIPFIKVIRRRCLDRCAGSAVEVRRCVAVGCPSWPFRMGTNPHRRTSEGRRAAGRHAAARLNGDRGAAGGEAKPGGSTGETGAAGGDPQVGPASAAGRSDGGEEGTGARLGAADRQV